MAPRSGHIGDQTLFVTAVLVAIQLCFDQLHCLKTVPSSTVKDNYNAPCKYMDSIAMTELDKYAQLVGNPNYTSTVIDEETVGYFDYEIRNSTFRQPVDRHARVCVCEGRPCIRLRCTRGMTFDEEILKCVPDEHVRDFSLSELTSNGVDRDTVSVFDHFGYTMGKVCEEMFALTPDDEKTDAWYINEQGHVFVENRELTQHEYGLVPVWNVSTSTMEFKMYICYEPFQNYGRFDFLPYGMILSVLCLILTLLVYAILPELRNVHGKALMCYLVCLANGQTILAFVQLNPSTQYWWCQPFSYWIYFWFLAAFFWLNVISIDLWWTFRNSIQLKDYSQSRGNRKFLLYSVYAWGCPLIALGICYTMDNVSWAPSNMRPEMGIRNCFLKPDRWIEFYYFNLPLFLIFVANASLFTKTAISIRRVQMEMLQITSKEGSSRHKSDFDKEKDSFGMFMRLFVVMGVLWLLETTSWLLDPDGWVFYLPDALNTVTGLLIFLLFVLKPKVKRLLIKRFAFIPVIRNISNSSNAAIAPTTGSNQLSN